MSKSLEEQLKDGSIEPGQPLPIRQTIEMQFANGIVESLQEQNKSLIFTESTQTKVQGSGKNRKLLVTVEGIHTGMTKNMTFYPGDTLESSVPTWTTPHHKPVLKNHNTSTEPLGRIISAEYVESTLTDKYTVRLKLEITDQDAIEKVLDRRYLTLSVGGSANQVVCSTCAKDIVAEGFCGHWRGRKYEGKMTHWSIRQYTGDEISFVNMPADVYSQVIAAELVTNEGGKNVGNNGTEGQDPVNEPVGTSTTEATNIIDGLLGNGTEGNQTQTEGAEGGEGAQQAEGTDSGNSDNGEPNTSTSTEGANGETLEEKVQRLESELVTANEKVSTLTAQLEQANVDNANVTAELSEAKSKMTTLEANLQSAEDEKATFQEQNVTLARFARKTLAERVVDLRIMQGKDKADERDTLLEQWGASSTKVLETTIKDLLESGYRKPADPIPNPGLAVGDQNSSFVDDNGDDIQTQKESTKKQVLTFDDLTNGMVKFMAKGNTNY